MTSKPHGNLFMPLKLPLLITFYYYVTLLPINRKMSRLLSPSPPKKYTEIKVFYCLKNT